MNPSHNAVNIFSYSALTPTNLLVTFMVIWDRNQFTGYIHGNMRPYQIANLNSDNTKAFILTTIFFLIFNKIDLFLKLTFSWLISFFFQLKDNCNYMILIRLLSHWIICRYIVNDRYHTFTLSVHTFSLHFVERWK